jgi:hypothetical protein
MSLQAPTQTPQFSIDDIPANPQLRKLCYFYVVHGTIPELMPNIAYRRIDKTVKYKRKEIKCPHCHSRLTFTDADTNVELFGSVAQTPVKCHFYFQCVSCHNEIGIRIAV